MCFFECVPFYIKMVEMTGIEPATLCVQGRCSSQLSYIPKHTQK